MEALAQRKNHENSKRGIWNDKPFNGYKKFNSVENCNTYLSGKFQLSINTFKGGKRKVAISSSLFTNLLK